MTIDELKIFINLYGEKYSKPGGVNWWDPKPENHEYWKNQYLLQNFNDVLEYYDIEHSFKKPTKLPVRIVNG